MPRPAASPMDAPLRGKLAEAIASGDVVSEFVRAVPLSPDREIRVHAIHGEGRQSIMVRKFKRQPGGEMQPIGESIFLSPSRSGPFRDAIREAATLLHRLSK